MNITSPRKVNLMRWPSSFLLISPIFAIIWKLDAKFLLIQVRILSRDLLDCNLLGMVNFFLLTVYSSVIDLASSRAFFEVLISYVSNVLLADIAHGTAALAANQLVAPRLFDDLDFTPRTSSDESFSHGLFDQMTFWYPSILLGFFARFWDMRFLLTQATADLFAVGV
jgi:hypothetical protein